MTTYDAQPEIALFGELEVRWDERVLRPRLWTTAQSHWAAALSPSCPEGPVLELFCGAGQIGLLVASLTGRPLIQVDNHPVATAYARHNAEAAGVTADVRTAEVQQALHPDERAAIVVLDPPWVPSAQVGEFPEDPVTAIDGGPDGTGLLVPGLEVALRHLLPGGHVVAQVGHPDQIEVVRRMLAGPFASGQWRVRETREYLPDGVLLDIGPV